MMKDYRDQFKKLTESIETNNKELEELRVKLSEA